MLVQVIIHSYTFLFKAIPLSGFGFANFDMEHFKRIFTEYMRLIRQNEFHAMMMMAHGASFLVDTLITTSSKSYAGLFQLNFASLLAFSKHLLQYLIQSAKEYNRLIEALKNKALDMQNIDNTWFFNFRNNFVAVATEKHFVDLVEPSEMERQHRDAVTSVNNLKAIHAKRQLLLKELSE